MRLLIFSLVVLPLCAIAQTPLSPSGGDAIAPAHIIDTSAVPVPEPSAQALDYHRGNVILWIVGLLLGFAIPATMLFTGFSARLRNWATRVGKKRAFIIMLYFGAFIVITSVVTLPLDYYSDFLREHAYGLSDQTFAKWIADWGKSLALGAVFGALLMLIPYALLRRSPRRWWLWTGLAMMPIMFFATMIMPVWIEPLFNDFGPMQNKTLEAKILALAHRAGIDDGKVYEVNKSVDTKTLNAYVTGFLSTKRIVLWDTIIKKLDDDELLFVMGHEMGHYVLGHVVESLLFGVVLVMLLLYAIHRTAGGLMRRFGARFGFSELADVASLPLLALLIGVYSFAASPIVNAFSRHNEHEADRFGLEITQNAHAAATAFVKLQTEDLAVPRPEWWITLLRGSHPSLGDRIDFANRYHPWREGKALKYGALFK